MIVCHAWLAADFLRRAGFNIHDPGQGQRRIATRGDARFELDPACDCLDCPPLDEPSERAA